MTVLTVFRSRLRAENHAEYDDLAARMTALAATQPGFVESKTFVAEDGERVTLVSFDSAADQAAWRDHPEHRVAQRAGVARLYAEYRLQVCELLHERSFTAEK